MAIRLTPKLLQRGLEVFILISLAGFAVTLLYGRDPGEVLDSVRRIRWPWLLVGLALASLDWFGGGLRNWVLAREIHPRPSMTGMILSGGMSAWAGYLTPFQSGNGPMMIYTLKRYGIPVPVALTVALMSFVSTVIFFALAGPVAIAAGAGRSLGQKDALLGLSLYDLFLGSLSIFAGLGVLFVAVIFFPGVVSRLLKAATGWLGARSARLRTRVEAVQRGIDHAHASVRAFVSWRGMRALGLAVLISGPSHANKLLAGYVALRALGIEAHFMDMLLVQTLITFLLYFAPTPGASGIGEVISALVMASYIPKALTPLYTLIWRCILSYFTIAFGFLVFRQWMREGLRAIGDDGSESAEDAAPA